MRIKFIAAATAVALAATAAVTPASARWHHHGWGGPLAGFAAGAIIGGALAAQGPYYYGPGPYYGGPPAYAYAPGGDAAYCAQRFRSYDPGSRTYLGYDGYRHSCP
jgi:hypothetical protein